jgi:hypothetical protein
MERKTTAGPVHVKAGDKGEISAVFATFNVIDHDRDVTIPGAFTNGADVVISAYQHGVWGGALPVGKGKIRTTDTEAILEGKFFLDTTAGLDTWRTLKALGQTEYSYGYDVLEADRGTFEGEEVQFLKSLKVHEVSPVLIGAGINTRTLDMKQRKETVVTVPATYLAAIRPHDSKTIARRWDLKAAQGLLPAGMSIDDLRSVHAFVNAEGNPSDLKSYGFLHHTGLGGEANLRACLAGIAELNGAKGAGMTPAERTAVHAHLASHLDDGDRDVPDLKATPGGELKFHEEAAHVLAAVENLIGRTSEVMALRRSRGKAISPATVDVLEWVYDDMKALRSLLDSPQEDADREYARFIHLLHTDVSGEATP